MNELIEKFIKEKYNTDSVKYTIHSDHYRIYFTYRNENDITVITGYVIKDNKIYSSVIVNNEFILSDLNAEWILYSRKEKLKLLNEYEKPNS